MRCRRAGSKPIDDGSTRNFNSDIPTSACSTSTLGANGLSQGVQRTTQRVERADSAVSAHSRTIARKVQFNVLYAVTQGNAHKDRAGRLPVLFFGAGHAGHA